MSIKDIEKENLEAHVELCSERYKALHDKFDAVNHRLDKQEAMLSEIRSAVISNDQTRNKQLMTWGWFFNYSTNFCGWWPSIHDAKVKNFYITTTLN